MIVCICHCLTESPIAECPLTGCGLQCLKNGLRVATACGDCRDPSERIDSLTNENAVLSRALGRAQQRCADIAKRCNARIEALESELMRQRALTMAGVTELAGHRDRSDLREAPGEPPSKAAAAGQAPADRSGSLAVQSVLYVGGQDPPAMLDATLAAADWVICQTGCLSHDAYWRVQDHCRRTGKRCVFIEPASRGELERWLEEAVAVAPEGSREWR